MKKQLFSFLLMCFVALAAHSAPVYYLDENFDSGSFPAGWSQEVMSDEACSWIIDTVSTYPNGAYSGTGRAALRNADITTHGYVTRLITPAMNLPAGAQYEVSFAYAQANRSGTWDQLKVYYSFDGVSWTLLEEFTDVQNQWQLYKSNLVGAAGQSAFQLAFEANDFDGYGVVLDDVKVMKKSECADVTNFGAQAASNSAIIYYQKDFGSTAQLVVDTVEHDMASFEPSVENVFYYGETTNDQVELPGIDSQRKYYAYIRTICDDNESGFTAWVSMSFTTSIGFPFFEGFSGSALPSNWQNLYGSVEDAFRGILPVVNTNSTYNWKYSSSTSIMGSTHVIGRPYYEYSYSTYTSTYAPAWFVSPAIDLTNVSEPAIELSFKLAMSSSETSAYEVSSKGDYKFMVLISMDGGESWSAADATTYEGTTLSATAQRKRIALTGYEGNVIQIAFVAVGAGTSAYFHLDDVKIDAYDINCGDVKSVYISDLSDMSAMLNWTLLGKDSVIVELSKSSSFSTKLFSDTIDPTDHKRLLDGLDSKTTYYARVCQFCPDAEWVSTSFTTAQGLDYLNAFTSSTWPSEWKRYTGVTAEDVFNGASLGTPGSDGWKVVSNSSVPALGSYVAKFNLYSSNKYYWMVSPAIYLNPASATNVELSLVRAITAYTSSGISTSNPSFTDTDDQYIILVSDDAGATWKRENAIIWDCVDTTAGYLEHHDLRTLTAEPEVVKMDLTHMIGKTIQVAIYAGSTISGSDNDVCAGNITVKRFDPNCAGLENIVISADIHDAKAKWGYKGTPAAIAQLATNSTFTEGLISDTIAPADSVKYEGLEANSKYYFRVKQDCELGEWSQVMSFTTHCEADSIPYINGFEDDAANAVPNCWTLIQDATGYPKVMANSGSYSVYSHTGSKYLSWGSGSTYSATISYASLPAFESAVNEVEMSFWLRNASSSNGDTIEVGVMSNPLDPATFVKVGQVVPNSATYQQYFISFANYAGQGQYIAFKRLIGRKYAVYIDDIDVHALPACHRIGDVSASSMTANGATIKFDQTNAENFQIVFASEAIDPDTLASVADSLIAYNQVLPYAPAMVISDAAIQPNTLYYAYVRGICNEEEAGAWSLPISFTTLCAAVDPASYGVETFDVAKDMACWTTGFLTPGSSSSYATAGRKTDTKYGAYLQLSKESANSSSSTYSDGAYAISPELDVDDITNYQITFSAATIKSEAINVARLEIGVVTNPSELDTYAEIKIIPLTFAADSAAEKVYVIDFKNYPGDIYGGSGKYIMFKSVAATDSTNYVLIDNISFQEAASCPQIIETSVDSVGLNGALLKFENNGAAHYEVLVSTINTRAVDTLASADFRQIVATNRAEISGLNSSTQYYAYVRAICGEGDSAVWSASAPFMTKFGVPYTEQFESSALNGWSVYSSANFSSVESMEGSSFAEPKESYYTTITWSLVNTSSSSIIQGLDGNACRSFIYYSSNYNSWLISPVIDMTANAGQNIKLTFKAARSNTSYDNSSESAPTNVSGYKLYVVISTDDGATWKKVDATSWLTDGSGDYDFNSLAATAKEYTISLSKYAGQSIRLGFYTESASISTNSRVYVDDIHIFTYEAICQGVRKLAIESQGTNAKATWEIEGTPAKTIIHLSDASDFANLLASDTLDGEFEKEYSDLALSSTYYVRAKQADCEDAEWQIKSFKTPLGLPFGESFNASVMPSDWTIMSGSPASAFAGTNPTISSGGWIISSSNAGLPANHTKINIYSSTNNRWLVSPAISLANVEVGTDIQLSFDFAYTNYNSSGAIDSGSDQALLLAVSEDGGASWSQANSWEWSHTDSTAAVIYPLDSIALTGTHLEIDFSRFAGKSIQFAFVAISKSQDNDFHLANIALKPIIANCDDPTDLAVDSVSINLAALSWMGDSAKVSVVEYATSADFSANLKRDTVAAGLVDTLLNLKAATKYYVRVHQLCGGDNKTGYANVVNFLTDCDLFTITKADSYLMDFENEATGTGSAPVCWTIKRGSGYPYVYNYSSYAHSGSNMLYFGGYSGKNVVSYAILPEVTNNANELQVNFFLAAGSSYYESDSIYIGVMTDPNDVSTFVPVKGFQAASSSYVEQEVWLNTYEGDGHYVAIKRVPVYDDGYYYGSYIDDIKLSKLPTCHRIEGLKASALSHSAVISHDASNAGQYELIVTSKVINPDTVATVADSIIVYHATEAELAINVSGLEAQTRYYVYLRGVCDEEDKSDWESLNFTTECESFVLPFVEDFNALTAGIPSCWDNSDNTFTTASNNWNSYSAGHTGNCVRLNSFSASKDQYGVLVTPLIALDKAATLAFWCKNPTGGNYSVLISADGGQTMTTLLDSLVSISDWTQQEIDLALYAGQEVRIYFKGVSNYGSGDAYLYLDDIEIVATPSCKPLKDLAIANISRREFDVNWSAKTPVEGQHYDFVLSKTQLDDEALELATKQDLDTTFYHASGLDRETTYYIYVRANCGEEDGVGAWMNTSVKTKGLSACEEFVVADGVVSNDYLPVYGSYVDDPQRSQTIYPASMLTDLVGQQITALSYFVKTGGSEGSSASYSWGNKEFTVRMAEVDETSLSTGFVSADFVDVYSGPLTANVADGMHVELNTPFNYNGGNLLIEFVLPIDASGYASCTFYGATVTNAGRNAYGTTYLTSSGTARDFLPKVAFSYCYAIDACPAVDSIGHELTGEGTNTARIAWKAGAGDYANTYDLIVSDTIVTDFASAAHVADSIDALYYDVENLEAYTDYYVYVRVNCDAENMHDGTSGWSEAHSFRTNSACRVVTDLHIAPTGKTSALATWQGTAQDNNFQYILSDVALSKEEVEVAIPTADALTDTFAILSGLTSGQKYYFYVANNCGDGGVSPYIADSMLMPDGCPAVADLRTNYVAFNAVGIEWNRGAFGEEEQWLIGIEEEPSRDLLVADSSYLFIGLEPDSTYHFFAQAVCGEGDSSLVRVIEVHTPNRPSGGAVIAEGSAANTYTPIYGTYCDDPQRSQSIYPADMLSDLEGQVILGLNYVVTSGGSIGSYGSWENATFNVRIGVTTQNNLSSGWATSPATIVYSGTLHASVADGMQIVLDEPFTYEGGNLLIEFELPIESGYSACTFQGIAQTGGSRTVYGSTTGTGTVRDFLPQVEFVCANAGCEPAKLAASNITTTSADINWFPGDKEMSWAVLLSDSIVPQAALDTLTGDIVEVLKLHYDDLTPDVDYHFYIRSFCSATETSAWKELIFRTMPSCFAPTALDADSLASDAARVVWTEMNEGFSGNYTVAYGKKDSFNLAVDTTYQLIENVADTVVLLSGLEGNTEYSFAVRSNCGEGDLSRWSEIANFRTECGAITSFPWSENFDSYTTSANFTPDCWVNEHIAGVGTNIFKTSTSTNGTNTTTQLQLPDMTAGTKTILVLPEMNLPENYEFKLDVYRNGTPSTYGDVTKEGVRIYISQSDTIDASAQELGFISRGFATADAAHGIPAETASGWYTYTFALPVSGNNYIIIVGESQYCASTYIDNFLVRAQPTCAKPSALAATAGIDTALVVWQGNANSYIVELSEGNNFAKIDTLIANDTAIVLRNLKSATAYSVRVTGVCDDAQSDVSFAIEFVTSAGLPFAENFDASTSQPGGWKRYEGALGDWETTTYGWSISASAGGVSSNHEYSEIYGYEGFYDYWYDEYYDDYIAQYTLTTPEIILNAADGNGVELSFDMSLTNSTTSSTAPDPANCLGREFSVVISTDGGESWTNLASWSDNGNMGLYSSIPNSQTKYSLDLTAYAGQSIMIGFYHNFGTATLGYYDEYYGTIEDVELTYIHLDNIVMKEVNPNCMGVNKLAVSNVSFVGAQVDWGYKGGSTDAVIALSKSNVLNLDNAIVVDTVLNDSTYLLPALEASTTYYVFVEQLCDEGETSAWEMTSFATAIGAPYNPVFNGSIPSDWTKYSGLMDSVVLKSDLTTTTSGWGYASADTIINTGHVSGDIWSTSFQYWLISPSIDLTPNVGDGLMLNFDLGRRPYTRSTMNDGVDDKFMVIISEDGGETWTLANATVWNNDGTGQYVYNDIQEHGQTFHINLSEYAGKTIQIAFYGESTISNADNYVHFGNISINTVEAINYLGDVCDGEDYDGLAEGNPFFISSDEYKPGLNIYSQYHPADPSIDGSQDTMLVLNLMVNMPASYEYTVEVCEGEHYVDANFDINITLKTPTVQRKRGLKTEAGCDSTIVMNLIINPIQRIDIFGLTCQGTPYHFGGKDIYQAGTYMDTASSVITGCDSITTLYLSYDQPSEDWRDKILCNGDSYTMADGTVISAPGQYIEHAVKTSGCDSLIHWNIMVADEFGVARDTVDVTELPYFFNNQQVLAADATIGSHDVTVPMSCGDGILRILVEQKTGLLDIRNNRRDVQKLIRDEQLVIIRNGKSYNALGGHVKSDLR